MSAAHREVFSSRLLEALRFNGLWKRADQVRRITEACGVTAGTARRWLNGTAYPGDYRKRYVELQEALRVSAFWLWGDESSPPPREWRMLLYFNQLPEIQRARFEQIVAQMPQRPHTRDPIERAIRGEIAFTELVRLAS